MGDYENQPAAAAIASYFGIDLSPEGKAARYKKGINIIVTGPPLSGKSYQAKVFKNGYGTCYRIVFRNFFIFFSSTIFQYVMI